MNRKDELVEAICILFKDINGVKPRHIDFVNTPVEEIEAYYDRLCVEHDAFMEAKEIRKADMNKEELGKYNIQLIKDLLASVIESLPPQPQRQDSVKDQLADLQVVANRLGMYDAADAIRQLFETEGLGSLRYGCHCDLEDGMEPDGCVIDQGLIRNCIYAKPGMRKEKCKYWRVCGS